MKNVSLKFIDFIQFAMIKLFNQYVLIEIIDTNMFTERLLPDSNISNRVFGRIWNTLYEDERDV